MNEWKWYSVFIPSGSGDGGCLGGVAGFGIVLS